MHGQSGGDELRIAWLQGERRLQAGAKIQSGAACGGVGGQEGAYPLVKDFEINLHRIFL
jgi:hypothetical protein